MDLVGGKIYWADNGSNRFSFASLNNTGGGGYLNTTGASAPSGPAGVATDPVTGKIYWGDNSSGTLSFAKLNDTGRGGELGITGAPKPSGPTFLALLKRRRLPQFRR